MCERAIQIRRGLTLMELVVVLAILAATATVATVATDRILMQKRFELTQTTLEATRSAIVGKHGPGESTVAERTALEGFVADIGRLPHLFLVDGELQPLELWQVPTGSTLTPYDWKQSGDDSEVYLYCGWRGPYLDLPVGEDRLVDGWGRSFQMLSHDNTFTVMPAAAGDELSGMVSLGSDGESGVSPNGPELSGDLAFSLVDQGAAWVSDVTVTVLQKDEDGERVVPYDSGTLTIRLFGPNPADGSVGSSEWEQVRSSSDVAQAVFGNVPVGSKVIRAYFEDDDGNEYESVAQPINVTRGGQTSWELLLPAVETETEPPTDPEP